MTKNDYLKLLMAQPIEWVKSSASAPSIGMTKTHVALHFIAIRRMSE